MGDKVTLIIVTYAAFKVPWFRQVSKLEWDFVGRTRRPNTFSSDEENSWNNICNLFGQATTAPKAFQDILRKIIHLLVDDAQVILWVLCSHIPQG